MDLSSNWIRQNWRTVRPAYPGLLTVPQNRFNGYIQGFYPTFTVQPGDKFQSTVGCEFGAAGCYITFRLDYMTASGFIGTFWQWREQNEGKYYSANVDLTPLAGRSVRFILTTLATGSATNDRALWGSPRIVRVGGAPPTTPAPPTANWPAYINSTYGFNFKYPPGSERFFETTNSILIKMPIAPGHKSDVKNICKCPSMKMSIPVRVLYPILHGPALPLKPSCLMGFHSSNR